MRENSDINRFSDIKNRAGLINRFVSSKKSYPVLTGLAAGLYPILFYYSRNFSLIDSWGHFYFFVLSFLVAPMVGFYLACKLFKIDFLSKWQNYVLPFLNMLIFLFLISLCLIAGVQKIILVAIIAVAALYAYFFHLYYKYVVVFQFLLAVIGLYSIFNTLTSQLNFSEDWKEPVDDIESVVLTSKPNIYLIQPDGYVNFSELKKGYYHYDNSSFETYLIDNGFTNYDNFRSNYASTLSSNSATFMMKHHYYNGGLSYNEGIDARQSIVSDNTTLRILKNNGYKTYFITEKPYLLVNHPSLGYDYSNFSIDEIGYISSGLSTRKDILKGLDNVLDDLGTDLQFFFIEFFNPGHILGRAGNYEGKEKLRISWLESLERANVKLTSLIDKILAHDEQAMIIILADHGGSVGMDFKNQIYYRTQNRDLIYSMFSSQLSIRWPEGISTEMDANLKTSVNLFRVLFAQLGDDPKYLAHLQADESYVVINKDAPNGVYMYINQKDSIVFKKH